MYRQLNYNGSVLQYQCVGSGTAVVVLLHGFGEHSGIWHFQKDYLAQHFKILIPDLPGSGRSQAVADMSLEGLADAIHFILQHEGIDRCVLIGHSMGGYIALAFAEKQGAMLDGFGLFQSTAFADTVEKKATRAKGIQFIKAHGAYDFLKTSIPALYSPATKEHTLALIHEQVEGGRGFSAEALVAYYEAMLARPDRTAVLKQLACPVLFVSGAWDTAVPATDALAQSHLPQIAYIHVLRQSGHMGMVEEPEKSNQILNDYLSATFRQP